MDTQAATEPLPKFNLAQKLAKVRQEFGYVQKRGFNQSQNYHFATFADMVGPIGDALALLNVIVQRRDLDVQRERVEVKRQSGAVTANFVRVRCKYVFIDADAPCVASGRPGERVTPSGYDELVYEAEGDGQDYGDKALYKAFTGAMKYAYVQAFQLATGDDPEKDDEGDRGGASGAKADGAGNGGGRRLSLKRDEPERKAGNGAPPPSGGTVTMVSTELAAEIAKLAMRTGTNAMSILAQMDNKRNQAVGTLKDFTELTLDEGKWVKDVLERKIAKQAEAGATN